MANEKQMAALAKARAARAASLAAKGEMAAASPVAATQPEVTQEPAATPPSEPVAAPEANPAPVVERLDLAAAAHVPVPKPIDPSSIQPAVNGERVVEVQVLRPYAPRFLPNDLGVLVEQGEIKTKVPANSIVKLPQSEATRAMRIGIARPTENTFG